MNSNFVPSVNQKNFLKKLKAKAWKKISLFVRKQGAKGDLNQCYTCLRWVNWKYDMHAGHYIHNKLDYDLRNLKPQCVQCNYYRHGELGKYHERLLKEHGQNWLDQLEAYAQVIGNNYLVEELNKIIEKYK